MIHTIYTLTIREYIQIEKTGNLSLLKKWYNPFPVKWFNTQKFFDEFNKHFNAIDDTQKEVFKLLAINKITLLDTMINTLRVLMRNTNERNLFSAIYGKKPKKEVGIEFYVEKIKKLAFVEIKDGEDLNKLKKEVQRLIHKYKQDYPQKAVNKEPIEFIIIAWGVFEFFNEPHNPNITLYELYQMQERASKISKERVKNNAKR